MGMTRSAETIEEATDRRQKDQVSKFKKRSRIQTFEEAVKIFKSECKKQPVYICTSCHRLLWRKGVQKLNMKGYDKVEVDKVDKELTDLVLHEK